MDPESVASEASVAIEVSFDATSIVEPSVAVCGEPQ
jgi:hypothetical protein